MIAIVESGASSMDNANPRTGEADKRTARVQSVIEDCVHRRLLGEQVTDEQVLENHPALADELRPRLAMLRQIEQARRFAEEKPKSKTEMVVDESFDTKSHSRNNRSTSGQDRAIRAVNDSSPALQALLSRYDVVTEVARGGMGIVYLGRHKVLDRQVALKVLLPGTSNERFLHEARVMASLRSPHVVTIHDYELLPDGQAVIAMEWMDGGDLAGLIRTYGGRLSEREAHSIMLNVCQGMEAAADRGVIHRDLKPSNILLDASRNARVADFGLARGLPGAVSDLTASGQMMGTPHYMAPEQAENPKAVDTRSDIYSFGATFYHTLTGNPPFDGPTPFSVLLKHKTEEARPLHEANPTLSLRICHIISRCLRKEPDERYNSFAALRQSLLSGYAAGAAGATGIPQELIDRYYARRAVYLYSPDTLKEPDVYYFPDRRPQGCVRISCGDIVTTQVDAIVNFDTTQMLMNCGIPKDIRNAAGEGMWLAVQRYAPLSLGRVVATEAGGLRTCKRILHAAVRSSAGGIPTEVVEEAATNVFGHATSLGIESVAIPICPTLMPHDQLNKGDCLDILFFHLLALMLTRPSSVREVTIVRSQRS